MVSTTLESIELGFVLGEVLATDYVKSRQRLLHQLEVMIGVVEDGIIFEKAYASERLYPGRMYSSG